MEQSSDEEALTRACALLRASRRAVALTGAGLSTESGIPDFRSPGGVWERFRPIEYGEFVRSAEARSDERALRGLLKRLQAAAQEAYQSAPEREDIASIRASLRELEPLAPLVQGSEIPKALQGLLLNLQQFVVYPPAQRGRHAKGYVDAAAWLKRLRNQLVHAPQAERPAYSLDDEED